MLFVVIILIIALVIVVSNIAVVQQSRAYVIERLGAFQTVWGVGLHFKVPFIDRIARRGASQRGLPCGAVPDHLHRAGRGG